MDLPAASSVGTGRPALTAADVADMLDSLEAAYVRTTIAELEDLLATLRPAARIRARLVGVDADTLKAALQLRAQRAPRCERGRR